jgi:hypothetical protein
VQPHNQAPPLPELHLWLTHFLMCPFEPPGLKGGVRILTERSLWQAGGQEPSVGMREVGKYT